jgi:DNA-binding YbaB/EbfC family protein
MFDKRALRQAQELQSKLLKIQEGLKTKTVEGKAAGGAVTVVMNGHQEVQSVKIAPEVVNPEEVDVLEDLVLVAIRDAANQAKELAAKEMGALTGGMKIPGLPF